jgi:heat shock protein HtpX
VRNRDILISAVVATVAGAITMLARMAYYAELFGFGGGRSDDRRGGALSALAMMIVAPLAALLIQLAISRSREYQADATAAQITGNPFGLARALDKIEKFSKRIPMQASPAMSHMFIIQPLSAGGMFFSLFSTHPPTRKRIERLIGRDFV